MRLHYILTVFFLSFFIGSAIAQWNYVGPGKTDAQVKGMIRSVWMDEKDPNTVFAGSATGGLFRTGNALDPSPLWENITNGRGGMDYGVSDIAVRSAKAHKEIFIATSSRSALPKAYGCGILRSSDGGSSWERVGPGKPDDKLFPMEGLVMNPENEDEMIAYSTHLAYHTLDAWKNHTVIDPGLDMSDPHVSICDAEFAPYEKGKFYLCTRTNNSYNAKVFLCEENGKRISDIGPKDIKTERMEIATVRDPRYKGRFYLAEGWIHCYVRYFDGQRFSAALNKEAIIQVYAGAYWNFELSVNQLDTSVLYLSMTQTSRSIDGGRTFNVISQYNEKNAHADVRAQQLVRSSVGGKTDLLIVGNDGGVSMCREFSPPGWENLNGRGLDVNQFWGISVAQDDSLMLAGGTADNGGFIMRGNEVMNTMGGCGDGYMAQVIDREGAVIECNTPSMFFHDLRKNTAVYLNVNDGRFDGRRPLMKKDSFIYTGYSNLWRISEASLKMGSKEFEMVSKIPDITNATGGIKNAAVRALHISERNEAVMSYKDPNWGDAANNGKLFYCDDLGKNVWKDITNEAVCGPFAICQWSEVNALVFDEAKRAKFYLVSRDVVDQSNSRLFSMCITDSGNWALKEVGHGLPRSGINDLLIDRFSNVLYAATDEGVWYSDLSKDSLLWSELNVQAGKLPSVPVFDLDMNYMNNTVYAGTFGRGIWSCRAVSTGSGRLYLKRKQRFRKGFKVDGKLQLAAGADCSFERIILTPGSEIVLGRKSTLRLKRNSLRNDRNSVLEPEKVIQKKKGSRIIYSE